MAFHYRVIIHDEIVSSVCMEEKRVRLKCDDGEKNEAHPKNVFFDFFPYMRVKQRDYNFFYLFNSPIL